VTDPRIRSERGVSSVELAFYTPILFLVIFMTVQFGLTWHANQVASAAAREAARVTRVGGGTPAAEAAGEDRGRVVAATVGERVLRNVDVDVEVIGENVRATVSGDPLAVIGGLTPRVSKTVEGPIEQFVPDL
jgi:Flp pilus assembly protein TadG